MLAKIDDDKQQSGLAIHVWSALFRNEWINVKAWTIRHLLAMNEDEFDGRHDT